VLAGNLIGTILFSEKAFGLLKTEGGTILNVMSTAAHVARANEAIYCAAKWAARAYTETMRVEAKGLPIRIISAYPGGMATRFWREASGHKVDANKFMDPQDVARTIVDSLHDRASSYVSDLIINRK
jgi:short-subunit dehydrogenase